MEKFDYNIYERILLFSNKILAAAEINEWEEALALQDQLNLSFDLKVNVDWLKLTYQEREKLESILEATTVNFAKIEILFGVRQKYLSGELQKFNTSNKINKAYSSKNI